MKEMEFNDLGYCANKLLNKKTNNNIRFQYDTIKRKLIFKNRLLSNLTLKGDQMKDYFTIVDSFMCEYSLSNMKISLKL